MYKPSFFAPTVKLVEELKNVVSLFPQDVTDFVISKGYARQPTEQEVTAYNQAIDEAEAQTKADADAKAKADADAKAKSKADADAKAKADADAKAKADADAKTKADAGAKAKADAK